MEEESRQQDWERIREQNGKGSVRGLYGFFGVRNQGSRPSWDVYLWRTQRWCPLGVQS